MCPPGQQWAQREAARGDMGDPPDHGGDWEVELGLAAELLALPLWVRPLYLGVAAAQWGDAGWDSGSWAT